MRTSLRLLKLDIFLQSLLLGGNTLLIISSLFNNELWILFLLLQFGIGVYQVLISGAIHLLNHTFAEFITQCRQVHFWGSIAYVMYLTLLVGYVGGSWFIGLWIMIVIPQIIAYFYFILTLKDYNSRISYLEGRPTIFAY